MKSKLIDISINNSKLLAPLNNTFTDEKDIDKAMNEVLNNKEVFETLKKLSVE